MEESDLRSESHFWERRFRDFSDILPVPMVLLDRAGTPLWGNRALHRMLGSPSSRVDTALAASMIHSADLDRIGTSFRDYAASGDDEWIERYRIVGEDGRVVLVENRIVRELDEAGEHVGFFSYLTDLSHEGAVDLQAPYGSTTSALDNQALGIGKVGHWSRHAMSDQLVWSDSMYDIYGVERGTKVDPEIGMQYIPGEQREALLREAKRAVEENRSWEIEHDLVFPCGAVRRILTRGTPTVSDGEQRVTGIAIDVSDQREREQQMRQAEKLRAIGQLASGVAHDFNNMLGSILGNATVLAEEVGPSLQRPVAEIRIAAERVTQLTRKLLTFSRRQQLEKVPSNLHELIDEAFTLVVQSFSSGITIRRHFRARECTVLVDPSQIQSAFLNLLVNSRDALAEDGRLEIETNNVEGPDGETWVEVVFTDDGSGMEEDTKRRAFEPFYTTRRAEGGTGLGLSATYGAVLRHGGTIDLDSEPGVGTTFRLRFKTLADESEDEEIERELPRIDACEASVWVVDDEPLMLSLAERVFARNNFDVRAFESGDELLRAFETSSPSFFVIDHHMPGMSGRKLVEILRERGYDQPIVMVTGNVFDIEEEWIERMRLKSLVEKPYTVSELLDAVLLP